MANAYETGAIYSSALPAGLRTYYEQMLLQVLREQSIFVPFCMVREDFAARSTGVLNFTEVMDTAPNWNPLSESQIWLEGAHLDSRSINLTLEIHGNTLKFHDYTELVNYWNSGDFTGLVRGKMGQNMVDHLDILAMNAHLDAYNVLTTASATSTSRFDLDVTDLYDPEKASLARIHLEERNIPGVANVDDSTGQTVVAITSPRVIHDIRTNGGTDTSTSKWFDVMKYANPQAVMRHEAGAWDGVRYIKSPRLLMRNFGKVIYQTTLAADTAVGQGAQESYQGYSVGQSTSTRYVTVTSSADFQVGDYVTIHSQSKVVADGSGGNAVDKADGTQETRLVVAKDVGGANRLVFDRPLLKSHLSGDYVTKAVTLTPTIVLGGPAVVYGVGERPHPIIPPKTDDMMAINRIGWRGFLKFQLFRPEWVEVIWSAVTTN